MLIDEFTVAAEIAFERLMTPTKGLRPEQMEEPMVPERWSFKELGQHLSEQNLRLLKEVEAVFHGREVNGFAYGPCRENGEQERISGSQAPLKRAMNELRVGHSALMEAAKRVEWSRLDPGGNVPDWLVQGVVGHYDNHRISVEKWVEGLVSQGKGPMTGLVVRN